MTFEHVPPGSIKADSLLTNASATARSSEYSRESNDPVLGNLWSNLDRVQPVIPDRLSVSILEGIGIALENSDQRLARLVSLASQKFLTDILADAMGHWRITNGQPTGLLTTGCNQGVPVSTCAQGGTLPTVQSPNAGIKGSTLPAKTSGDRRATLTLDDLLAVLNDRGIHVARPSYYR